MKKDNLVFLAVISTLLIGFVIACGCDSTANTFSNKASNPVGLTGMVAPVDYGNGVLYFPCNQAIFANSLSVYLKTHPEKHTVAMAGDGTDTNFYGADRGYFVIVEEKV